MPKMSRWKAKTMVKVEINGKFHHCMSCQRKVDLGRETISTCPEIPSKDLIGEVCCCVHGKIVGRRELGEYLVPHDQRILSEGKPAKDLEELGYSEPMRLIERCLGRTTT